MFCAALFFWCSQNIHVAENCYISVERIQNQLNTVYMAIDDSTFDMLLEVKQNQGRKTLAPAQNFGNIPFIKIS